MFGLVKKFTLTEVPTFTYTHQKEINSTKIFHTILTKKCFKWVVALKHFLKLLYVCQKTRTAGGEFLL